MLDRGVEIISSEFQMQKYLQRFGIWHYNKLMHSFKNLGSEFLNLKEIDIIDYACGQGIGAFLYHQFLRENKIEQKIRKITLIEPSEISLKRAALHLECVNVEAQIVTINKFLGDLDKYDIIPTDRTTLHIFSNIIDIESIDLFELSNYVKSKINKLSHIICVSPRSDNAGFTKRINDFCNFLDGNCYYKKDLWRNDWEGDCAMSLRIIKKEESSFTSNMHANHEYVNHLVGQELILNMITVEPGTFLMGATSEQESDAWDNEFPVHRVEISTSFRMTKYPVTQRLWFAIMGNNPSVFKHPDSPVDSISWYDCIEFIDILNEKFEFELSLPTEAQWEFAARGGNLSKSYKYAGSNEIEEVAWSSKSDYFGTHKVGSKKANELGFFDMNGNIWEWCQDWFSEYPINMQIDPMYDIQTNTKVIRGGGWSSGDEYCRVTSRQYLYPTVKNNFTGFRLVSKR